MWFEFSEKVVWIIGFWNIWKKVYSRLKSFWVKKFLIFDPFLKKEDVEKNEFCFLYENKEDIFTNSDIISFHIPLLDSTKNFLWEKEFSLLKKDVVLVNTSRWWIIDEKYLINFLKENNNSSFFADVWEEEPRNPKDELLKLDNVLITPHIWAMTKQAEEKMHYFPDLL
jgi:phosphoglycerate dehydrogenase-like enzyme